MPQYRVSALTSAGTTTLPIISLYGGTTTRPKLREIHLFNTTSTAVSLKLVRLTTTGTQGAGLIEMPDIPEDPAAIATAFNTHTVAPTITTGDLERWRLPAQDGAGLIVTFGALGIVVSSGTGQVVEATLVWEE